MSEVPLYGGHGGANTVERDVENTPQTRNCGTAHCELVSQNELIEWFYKVKSPTESSSYGLLLLIVNNKSTIL